MKKLILLASLTLCSLSLLSAQQPKKKLDKKTPAKTEKAKPAPSATANKTAVATVPSKSSNAPAQAACGQSKSSCAHACSKKAAPADTVKKK